MILYHYTCIDHGAPGIAHDQVIRPNAHPWIGVPLVWLTDLAAPYRDALGLTTRLNLPCDREEIRFTVDTDLAEPWHAWAHRMKVPREVRDLLETGAMPAHWWVSEQPIAAAQ